MTSQMMKKIPLHAKNILEAANNNVKTWRGRVFSNKMDKTATVLVARYSYNYKLGMYLRTYKKFKAHDEHNECRIGDIVEFKVDRKRSKTKNFLVTKILVPNRTGYEPLWPIERQSPTLTPEKALAPQVYLDHDIYRDNVEGLYNPYIVDEITSRAGGPSVPVPEPLGPVVHHPSSEKRAGKGV